MVVGEEMKFEFKAFAPRRHGTTEKHDDSTTAQDPILKSIR